jgi:hypothetical protein
MLNRYGCDRLEEDGSEEQEQGKRGAATPHLLLLLLGAIAKPREALLAISWV